MSMKLSLQRDKGATMGTLVKEGRKEVGARTQGMGRGLALLEHPNRGRIRLAT